MADIALDADALGRDRQRYHGLLVQAEQQIAAWNERADHLQQAIDGLDRLLELAGNDPAQDGGVPRGQRPGRRVAPAAANAATAPPSAPERPSRAPRAAPAKKPAPARAAPAAKPPPPTATPAAPEPVTPPAAEAPKGTDALRLVLESDPERTWTLADLIAALDARGWLPPSRRPEEGVRISLKRLAERGGATRTDDGRWRLGRPDAAAAPQPGTWPLAAEPPAPDAPAAQAAPAAEQVDAGPPPSPGAAPSPAPVGRPVGGTITEL